MGSPYALPIVSALLAIFVASRIVKVLSDKKRVSYIPGFRMPLSPVVTISALFPTSRFNMGLIWNWHWRNAVYERFGSDTISSIGYIFGSPMVFTSSKEVSEALISPKGSFVKPSAATAFVTVPFGPNLRFCSWHRGRRVETAPAHYTTCIQQRLVRIVSSSNTRRQRTRRYKYVWEESFRLFDEMSEYEGWDNKNEVLLSTVNPLTNRFSLLVIGRCGFGHHLPWKRATAEKGRIEISDALGFVGISALARLILPDWAFRLPIPWIQKTNLAFLTVKELMVDLIASRKESLKEATVTDELPPDIFTRMVDASNKEGKRSFTETELSGNMFLILFAGHETTSLALAAVLGLLAIYQDIQQEIFEEIQAVCSSDVHWAFEVASTLVKTEAAIVEASRMYPASWQMLRTAVDDIAIPTFEPHVNGGVLAVKKGQRVDVDLVGIHYNQRYFPDPEDFRPSRWYGKKETEYTSFSWGPRACIGRRFALTETVSFIAKLLRTWRVEPILNKGETATQWRRRVLCARTTLALGVGDVPLRLIRREIVEIAL